jgi:hypothetical protein
MCELISFDSIPDHSDTRTITPKENRLNKSIDVLVDFSTKILTFKSILIFHWQKYKMGLNKDKPMLVFLNNY